MIFFAPATVEAGVTVKVLIVLYSNEFFAKEYLPVSTMLVEDL